jgi:hypothetical protein
MSAWSDFLRKVKRHISSLASEGCDVPFFRGHSESSWKLLPAVGRYPWKWATSSPEGSLYFDFITQAGALLPENSSSWSNVFIMQHYGLPTRLLDWTETFSVALYFAIKNADKDAAIWILDPFELNRITINRPQIIHPTDLGHDYYSYFIEPTAKLEGNVVAISPLRHNPRVFHQRAGFTLHDDIETPLEDLHPSIVTKITLSKEAFSEAGTFLDLAGISEFTLFPDFDGLGRQLRKKYFGFW